MKKLLIVLLFCGIQAFGANDTLLIVNKGEALPKIIIKDKSNMRDNLVSGICIPQMRFLRQLQLLQ